MIKLADLSVFIVDDDNYFRELLYNILLGEGVTNIQQFENGVDCISNLSQQPDIVFLDYNMDPLNGLDVLAIAKRICAETIFMMVSAQKELQVAIDAINAGISDYIIKDENLRESTCRAINNINIKIQMKNKINRTIKPSDVSISAHKLDVQRTTMMQVLTDSFKEYTLVKAVNS